jgi:hypothetical protein
VKTPVTRPPERANVARYSATCSWEAVNPVTVVVRLACSNRTSNEAIPVAAVLSAGAGKVRTAGVGVDSVTGKPLESVVSLRHDR